MSVACCLVHQSSSLPREVVRATRSMQILATKNSRSSKEPSDTEHPCHSVQTPVWIADTGARPVHIAGFHGQGDVVLHEPVDAHTCLEVEFKNAAQIGRPNPGCSYARASIGKRNPARSGGKIVSEMGGETYEPFRVRRELCSAE